MGRAHRPGHGTHYIMIEILRRAAASWLSKILLGILVLSFGIWGIADIFRGFHAQTLARVAGMEITAQQYDQMFSRELLQLSNQAQRRITPAEAHAYGLDSKVFAKLLVDAHARNLGLGLTDETLLQRVQSMPGFLDAAGKFDRDRFREVLRQEGFSEASFLHEERLAILRQQIIDAMSSSSVAPKVIIDAFNTYLNEERKVRYFVLTSDQAAAIAEPDEAAIKAYFDQHKTQYTAPEYRKIAVMLATPDTLRDKIQVSDDDVSKEFDAFRSRYSKPERRHVLVLGFPDKEAAQKGYDQLVAGKGFIVLAKEMGVSEAVLDRGIVAKGQLNDPVLEEAAFGITKGTFSKPVDGALAPSIVQVSEILPAETKTLEDVKEDIRKEIATGRTGPLVDDIRGKVEDARAASKSIPDIAKELGLKLITVEAIDKSGSDMAGKPVADIPSLRDVVKLAFEADVGVETDPLDMGAGGDAWVDVLGITPERQKTLEEVKADVVAAVKGDRSRDALKTKAGELVEQLKKGDDIAKVAEAMHASVTTSEPLKRIAKDKALPAQAVSLAFNLPKDGVDSAMSEDGKSRIVFRVTEITPAKPLPDDRRKALSGQLANELGGDFFPQYSDALRTAYGLTINQALFDKYIGAGQPQ